MRRLDNPVEIISKAMGHAAYSNVFSTFSYYDRNWQEWSKLTSAEKRDLISANFSSETHPHLFVEKARGPQYDEIVLEAVFPQIWPSTSLGFGGVGGAAMTEAYTVVFSFGLEYAVYFSGRFAYILKNPNNQFFIDLKNRHLVGVAEQSRYASD